MPSVNFNRYTYLLASSPALYPSEDLYPEETLYPADGTLVDERFDKFDSGSISVSEMIVDDNIQFGLPIANKFECRLYGDVAIDNAYIEVFQTINNVDTPIFVGKVDSAKFDRSGTFKDVVAYDKFYELSTINVTDWWNTFWESHHYIIGDVEYWDATLEQVREDFVDYFGLEEADTYSLVNDDIHLTKTINISHMAFKDMLKAICELSGVFPNIGRDGKLEYISLDATQTPHDMTGLYEADSSDFDNYNSRFISGIHFLDSAGSSKLLVGTDLNCYTIESNIFTFSLDTATLTTLGTNLLNAVKDITFVPANVNKIVSDWSYRLGDKVTTDRATFYIFENNFSGPQLVDQNIVCVGDEMLPQVEHSANLNFEVINENIGKVEVDISGLRTQFVTYQNTTNARFERDESNLEQTAQGILLEVAKTQNNWIEENPPGVAIEIKFRGYEAPYERVLTSDLSKYYPEIAVNDYYLDISTGTCHKLVLMQTDGDYTNLFWSSSIHLQSLSTNILNQTEINAQGQTTTIAKEQSTWIEEHPIGTPITIKYKQFGVPMAQLPYQQYYKVFPDYAVNDLYLDCSTGYVYKLTNVTFNQSTAKMVFTWTYQYDLEKETTKIYSQIEQTAESITSTVAGLQAIWDVGDRTVDWKDYGKPDTIQVPLDETGPSVGDYYLDVELGRLYTFTSVSQEASEDFDLYDYYDVTYSSSYTRLTTIKSSVESEIQQLADSITLSVSGAVGQQASIVLRVDGEVQSSGTIDLTGAVSFYDLSTSGRTTINGANITTGYISCNRLNGGTITGQTISGGTISGATITTTSGNSKTTISNGFVKSNLMYLYMNGSVYPQILAYNNENLSTFYGGIYFQGSNHLETSGHLYVGTNGYSNVYCNAVSANGRVTADSLRSLDTDTSSAEPNCRFTTLNSQGQGTAGLIRRSTSGSSIRYKHDFKTKFNEDLDPHNLYDVKVYQFKYQTNYLDNKSDCRYDEDLIGFIVEELAKHYPIACDFEEKGSTKASGWNTKYMLPPMLKLIQEQHEEIETLKAQMQTLLGGNEK